jgi:DNA-binding transcriptional LysR family regulator
MSKLERLTSFICVIETNSFAAAARKQGVSVAAISRQITALEKELGAQLLQRSTRRLALTEIGRQYYQHCKEALQDLAEAESMIAQTHTEPSGVLHVTSSRYFAKKCLVPHLAEFMKIFPKITIKFELAERMPDLAAEGIDILFGVSTAGAPEWVGRRVATTRYVLCAAPKYLKKHGAPKAPADLTQHRYITHNMRKPANVITFKDNVEIYLEPVLWLNDTRAMLECALQGIGIVKLHEYEVAEAVAKKQLIEILSKYNEGEYPIYLYYQATRYLQPKIRCFIDFYLPKLPQSKT